MGEEQKSKKAKKERYTFSVSSIKNKKTKKKLASRKGKRNQAFSAGSTSGKGANSRSPLCPWWSKTFLGGVDPRGGVPTGGVPVPAAVAAAAFAEAISTGEELVAPASPPVFVQPEAAAFALPPESARLP